MWKLARGDATMKIFWVAGGAVAMAAGATLFMSAITNRRRGADGRAQIDIPKVGLGALLDAGGALAIVYGLLPIL